MEKKRIGFVGARFAGTDGVSLETRKWAHVLKGEGHECFYMAGKSDMPDGDVMLVPECFFEHEEVLEITRACFGPVLRDPQIVFKIEEVKHRLKNSIREYVRKFALDLLISENAVTIPLNLPLGLALTEFAIESGVPMIAHNHDFFWERTRFMNNCCWDYIDKAFPPRLHSIQQVVLNSSQQHQIGRRKGIAAMIIPNVMDYAQPPPPPDDYAADIRSDLGIASDEKFILQPTRIVKRKGIEHAIELVHRLEIPARLVISHASGDEGYDYYHRVLEYSEMMGVETVLCSENVGERRGTTADGNKIYSLEDMYRAADFVTYPSVNEGFGNAFLEAVYYKRPLLVNNYSIYAYDIRPRGFRTIEMDGFISNDTVKQTLRVLRDPELAEEMTEHNYELASRFFSYDVLRQRFGILLTNCFGTMQGQ